MWRLFVLAGLLLVSFQALLYNVRLQGNPLPPWIIYRSGTTLYRANADGSNPQSILMNNTINDRASWSPDRQWLWAGNHLYHYDDLATLRFENSNFTLNIPGTPKGWSPDGRYLLYEQYDQTQDIFRVDVATGRVENLTNGSGYNIFIDWSPDKSWLLIEREGESDTGRFFRLEDTTAAQILPDQYEGVFQGWSPDGQWFYFWDVMGGNRDLFRATLDGSEIQRITETLGADGLEAWSPDGQWIIISIWNDGLGELYRARPDGSDMQLITPEPSYFENVRWAGDWLFFSMGSDYFNLDSYRMRPDGTELKLLGDLSGTELILRVMNDEALVYFSDTSDNGITEGIAVINLDDLSMTSLTPPDSVSYFQEWLGDGFYYISRSPGINSNFDLHYTSLDGKTQYTITNSLESDTFVATVPFPEYPGKSSLIIAGGSGLMGLGFIIALRKRFSWRLSRILPYTFSIL